jgi:hypothetical protein
MTTMPALTRARWGLLLTLIPVLLVGCSTFAAPRYSISADTVTALRAYRSRPIAVGSFTATDAGRTEITCRAVGPIKTPDGEPFEAFIRKALIAELAIAEVYAPSAPVTLIGTVNHLDFSSGWTDAAWKIALTVRSSNGEELSIAEHYKFAGSYVGETACQQTAQAMMPAVQNLVKQLVQHPEFPRLVLVK